MVRNKSPWTWKYFRCLFTHPSWIIRYFVHVLLRNVLHYDFSMSLNNQFISFKLQNCDINYFSMLPVLNILYQNCSALQNNILSLFQYSKKKLIFFIIFYQYYRVVCFRIRTVSFLNNSWPFDGSSTIIKSFFRSRKITKLSM